MSSLPRRILIVGSGAREHALATALREHELVIAPGNGGTAGLGRNANVSVTDLSGLVALAERERVDLVVIGPEAPLTLGLVDVIGEEADARARLEKLARHPRDAYTAAKRAVRGSLAVPEAEQHRFVSEVIPTWAAPELKARLRAVLDKKKA